MRKHTGPKPKLTLEQALEVQRWYAELMALGDLKDTLARAETQWRERRREIGYAKKIAERMGVCTNTVYQYAMGRHKWDGSKDSSETGWRGPKSGTVSAAGTAKPATGLTPGVRLTASDRFGLAHSAPSAPTARGTSREG